MLYINDLPDSIEHSKVTLYADDTVIFANSSNATSQEKLQKDLSDADDWCNRDKLTINTIKSEVILFGRQKTNLNLSLQNCRLETVSQFKYLGIMLDAKLNFESHINEVLKKRFNGLMYRARDCFSKSSLLRSYQTYCKPIIMYGLLAYGSAAKSKIDKILSMQNKILRTIFNKSRSDHVQHLFESYEIETFYDLFFDQLFTKALCQ